MLTKISGRLTIKIKNNYFAPVIVGFVTAWIAQCKRCKISFFKWSRYL